MVIGGASPEGVAAQELPTPEDSMMIGGASPERVAIPELGVTPPDDSETDLEDELLNIVVSPLMEPVEALPVSPSLYPEPPVPAQLDPVPSVELRDVPLRDEEERPTIDLFPSFLISPVQSYYEPVTSPITSDLQDDSGYLPPDSRQNYYGPVHCGGCRPVVGGSVGFTPAVVTIVACSRC